MKKILQVEGPNFWWDGVHFSLRQIEKLIANSRWGPILAGQTIEGQKCVRFRNYCPENMNLVEWGRLIGANGFVLSHMRRFSRLSKILLSTAPLDAQNQATLLLLAPVHDGGEAPTINGDIMTGQKTWEQRTEEIYALRRVLHDVFLDYPGLSENIFYRILPILTESNKRATAFHRTITMFDHLLTGCQAFELSTRCTDRDTASHLHWMTYNVFRQTMPVVLDNLSLIPAMRPMLVSRSELITRAFQTVTCESPVIMGYYQEWVRCGMLASLRTAQISFEQAKEQWTRATKKLAAHYQVRATAVTSPMGVLAAQQT